MSQDTISLELNSRDTVGKRLHGLRKSGQVPAVIHDHGKDSIIVQGEYNAIHKAVLTAGKNHVVDIKVGSKTYNALVKDVARDPKKNNMIHVVFNAVKANEKVDAEVPVEIQLDEDNESTPAERAGLIVLRNIETVEVEAFPRDLPDVLKFNGEALKEAGDQATVGDLILPKGVTVKEEDSTVLATVFEPSALAAANDAAGGDAEPGDEANVEATAEETSTESSPEADSEKSE